MTYAPALNCIKYSVGIELACGSRVIIVTTANSNYVYWVSSPILEKQNIRMIENLSEIEGI